MFEKTRTRLEGPNILGGGSKNKVHTTNLIYNVNYKGEVGTRFLGFREKNNFYFPMSDKGSEKCH